MKIGVQNVKIYLEEEKGEIEYDSDKLDVSILIKAIEDAGFDAIYPLSENNANNNDDKVEIYIEGMTCSSCVNSIEENLKSMKGVKTVTVDLQNKKGTIEFQKNLISPQELVFSIEECGFEASLSPISTLPETECQGVIDISQQNGTLPETRIPINNENLQVVHLEVRGMTCGSCVANIERLLKKQPGLIFFFFFIYSFF